MSQHSEYIQSVFNNRATLNLEQLNAYAKEFFNLALQDADSARLLATTNNRITQKFKIVIKQEDLVLFMKKYPDLIKGLDKNWLLDSHMWMKLMLMAKEPGQPKKQRELLAKEFDGRTQHAVLNNQFIRKDEDTERLTVEYKGTKYPLITRHTRHFNQPLVSAGGTSRELILLYPQSPKLQEIYNTLKQEIVAGASTKEILQKIMTTTRNQLKGTDIDEFVNEQLKINGGALIPLDVFLERGIGVCRHHSLLNAYLLTRLVQDEILEGDVIHHRQDFKKGAHTWNVFRDHRDGKLYSLDSLWNNITSLAEKPGAINTLYREDVESVIAQHFGPAQTESNARKVLVNIKFYIESQPFEVKDYFFMKGGVEVNTSYGNSLRLPHHVAEIYQLLNSTNPDESNLLNRIQEIARSALEGADKTQYESTHKFYQMIVENKVPSFLQKVTNGPSPKP